MSRYRSERRAEKLLAHFEEARRRARQPQAQRQQQAYDRQQYDKPQGEE